MPKTLFAFTLPTHSLSEFSPFSMTDNGAAFWLLRAAASMLKKPARPFLRLLNFRIRNISWTYSRKQAFPVGVWESTATIGRTGGFFLKRRKLFLLWRNRWVIVGQEEFKAYFERKEVPDHWLSPVWRFISLNMSTEKSSSFFSVHCRQSLSSAFPDGCFSFSIRSVTGKQALTGSKTDISRSGDEQAELRRWIHYFLTLTEVRASLVSRWWI